MTADRLTVIGWTKLGSHKWKHSEGFIIARYWTIGVARVYYYSCFGDEDLYYKGVNEKCLASLRAAKDYFVS